MKMVLSRVNRFRREVVFMCLCISLANGNFVAIRQFHTNTSSVAKPTTSTALMGDFILAGLGATATASPSSRQDSVTSGTTLVPGLSPTTNSTKTNADQQNSRPSPTSSGNANSTLISTIDPAWAKAAVGCYESLWIWHDNYLLYSSQHASTTSLVYWTDSWTSTRPDGLSASRLTTLCDGHPRAIGSVTYSTQTGSWEYSSLTTLYPTIPVNYPTPLPCSLDPSQCAFMSKVVSVAVSIASQSAKDNSSATSVIPQAPCFTQDGQTGSVPFVISTITPAPTLLPKPTETCGDGTALVFASAVQLLYWPVLREDVNRSDYSWCNKFDPDYDHSVTRAPSSGHIPYIEGTRTGSGPNVFVTGSITITSPDIGLALTSVSGKFGCSPVIESTILTMPRSLLSSQRGARVFFQSWPFDLADLNWVCQSSDSNVFTTQFHEDLNCYQDVQALAYFSHQERWDFWTRMTSSSREAAMSVPIGRDYHPRVIPDPEFFTTWLSEHFGRYALWMPNGIWDPPIALGQAPAAAEATVPVFAPTTDPATGLQVTTEARPVPANPTQVPQTTRETIATSTISSQAAPHSTQTADVPKTTFVDPTTSIHFSFDPETPTSPNLVDTTPSSHTKGSTVTVNVVGTNFVIGGHTLGVGSATTINGQRLSHASSNIVVGTGAAAATMPVDASSLLQQITLGTATVNIGKLDTGVVQIGSQKLTVGGSVQTIEGHVVSAGTSALIVGQGSTAATISLDGESTQQLTIVPTSINHDQDLSTVTVGNEVLTVGGAAHTVDGQIVSAASNGLVIGAGSGTITIPVVSQRPKITVITVGSLTLTRSPLASGAEILANAATTVTLSRSGLAVTVGSAVASLGTAGLVVNIGDRTTTYSKTRTTSEMHTSTNTVSLLSKNSSTTPGTSTNSSTPISTKSTGTSTSSPPTTSTVLQASAARNDLNSATLYVLAVGIAGMTLLMGR